MEDTDKKFCSILLDVLSEKGVKDVICSPGSRNTPLLIAASARKELRKHIVADERSAAFMGIGISLVSKKPVALICTSGTALLNYAPAVAEAYYQCIPLIVISADRPQQWIDQDDSQTLRQYEALSNFVKKSYELPAYGDNDKELQWYANRIANDAMISACSGRKGPVHINVSLSEPLGKKRTTDNAPERIIDVINADAIGNKEIINNLAGKISETRVMLVAGFMPPDSQLQKAVSDFCKNTNVVIMAETLSNLHLEEDSSAIDSVLTSYDPEILDSLSPDIVISIGGSLVSRKLKEYLRRNNKKLHHWTLGKTHTTTDCFMALSLRIEADPVRFLRNIVKRLQKLKIQETIAEYGSVWKKFRTESNQVKREFIASAEWSELKAFDQILKSIPKSWNLFLSNGTSIRYAQLIRYQLPHASYCNRGVSGIDGSTSTAVGGALSYKGNTLLITGDLSMAYDIGALGLRQVPERMKIIVIDNQGGGIFRFIPSTSGLDEREEYFCASPNLPLKHLAEGYGWNYYEASSENGLRDSLKQLFNSSGKGILRVKCDGIRSAEILKGYMNCKVI